MENIEAKQNFLREEIIEKGYDPEHFTEFVSQLRDDGAFDLESWSMDELIKIVNYYKEKCQKETREKQSNENLNNNQIQTHSQPSTEDLDSNEYAPQPQIIENTPEDNISKENESIESKIGYHAKYSSFSSQLDKENFISNYTETIPCIKSDLTLLTQFKDLTIEISKPELVKPSIFSSQYYQFTLTIKEINKSVVRKLSDFEWFYHKLICFYPGIVIPYLQEKRVFEKKTEKEMSKKLFYIEMFMNSVAKLSIVRSGQFFLDFVSLPPQAWNKTIAELKYNEGPTSLNKFITMSGEINISISKDLDEKARAIEKDVKLKTACHTKITSAFDKLLLEMDAMSACLVDVSNAFKEMNKIYNESIFKNEYIETGFSKLSTAMNEWSECYKKQNHFIKYEIRFFLKYACKEINYINKHSDIFKAARTKYMDYSAKMGKLPSLTTSQTAEVHNLKRLYGYYLTRLLKEMKRLNKNQAKRFKRQFEAITDKKKELIADQISFQNLLEFKY